VWLVCCGVVVLWWVLLFCIVSFFCFFLRFVCFFWGCWPVGLFVCWVWLLVLVGGGVCVLLGFLCGSVLFGVQFLSAR